MEGGRGKEGYVLVKKMGHQNAYETERKGIDWLGS